MMGIITTISTWLIPCFIAIVLIVSTWKRVPAYEMFVEGGKDGVRMAFSLLPFGWDDRGYFHITKFRCTGSIYTANLSLLTAIGIPPDIIPLALVRPISGTAALGMTTEMIGTHGPDSFIGRLASTMQGSTDTTLYILTVYFGAVGIRKMNYALKVGLLADLVGIIASIIIVTLLFG